jgi:alkanesulfonate monooxygenase SsuD/methylene tetrahydromethanopterin reductase-like flavin-dependent oxidoreductase (luciferase family)
MYGLSGPEAAERFARLLPGILEALETGRFRSRDSSGAPTEAVELHVQVHQRPHPPLWYPTSNAESIPRLGEEGYNVLFGFGFVSPLLATVREQSRTYFERFRAATARGRPRYALPGPPPRFGVLRHVFVAPTDEQATAAARAAFADHFTSFAHLWRRHGSERFAQPLDLDQLVAERRMFVGSPATVTPQVTEAVVAGEVNYVACAFAWGSLDVEAVLGSLRLFRDEVIPAVRRAVPAAPVAGEHSRR